MLLLKSFNWFLINKYTFLVIIVLYWKCIIRYQECFSLMQLLTQKHINASKNDKKTIIV